MTREERIHQDIIIALEEALRMITRSPTISVNDYQRYHNAAQQAAQATAGINQLVGLIESKI